MKHLKKFLQTGEVPRNNRGGKRDGQSLLDCEAFKEKASLWLKEQIALHTQRRLRAIRKSKSFKSEAHLPMDQKTSHALSSARFRAYVEDSLLAEFYSEDSVRARAKSAALAEDMNPEEAKSLEEAMVNEISAARMTITDRTARNWLRKLGFKFRTKASKGVYHDGHDREDVQKYLHEGFLPRVKSYLRRTRFVREIIDPKTGDKRWEEVPPELLEGEREVIWINQDESLFYANDDV